MSKTHEKQKYIKQICSRQKPHMGQPRLRAEGFPARIYCCGIRWLWIVVMDWLSSHMKPDFRLPKRLAETYHTSYTMVSCVLQWFCQPPTCQMVQCHLHTRSGPSTHLAQARIQGTQWAQWLVIQHRAEWLVTQLLKAALEGYNYIHLSESRFQGG
jgi:hypothetical protein